MAEVRPELVSQPSALWAPVRFYAIVLLLRLSTWHDIRRAALRVIIMSSAVAAVMWAHPTIGFIVAIAVAGWWWVSSD